jgi:hypothetical protein
MALDETARSRALVVVGVALVIPDYRLGSATTVGAHLGLLSGCRFALLQLLNKGYRQRYSALAIAFIKTASPFSVCWG